MAGPILLAGLLLGLGCQPLAAADQPSCCATSPLHISVTRAVPQTGTTRAASTTTVATQDYHFVAQTITIAVGDTVTWSNASGTPHTSTSDTAGLWDSGTIANGGSFSHTFTSAGTFPYHCSFHQSLGMTGTVVVQAPPSISSPTSATASEGSAFDYTIVSSGATTFAATGLPAGLSVAAATGAITGTPTASGTFTVSLSASNSVGTGTATLTLTVLSPTAGSPAISGPTTATGTVGVAFHLAMVASNSPTSYSATGLPAGLSIDATSGVISGTPSLSGTTDAAVSATNASGTSTTTLAIAIAAAGGGSVSGGGTPITYGSSSGGHSCGLGGGAALIGLLAWGGRRWRQRSRR